MVYPAKQGYLITARGNPLTNAVRDGNEVLVHTAAGQDIRLHPLKRIQQQEELSIEGLVAMKSVRGHVQRMECYSCHARWAPQCYGCHVKIDYSDGKTSFDWLGAGHRHKDECPRDRGEAGYDTIIPGQILEQRSYLRFEDPPMGINGEGRVTTVAPGCQASVTVIGEDGKPLLLNHIFRTPPGTEGSGPEGQLSLDLSPLQPHTMGREIRSCESCHASAKALGHGIDGGKLTRPPDQRLVVDLRTVDGWILAEQHVTQLAPVEGLSADWSRFVTEDGRQLQTVGHHFQRSRPLNNVERDAISRQGVCLSCHREIPDRSIAVNLLHHVASAVNQIPKNPEEHDSLVHTKIMLFSAWTQVLLGGGAPLIVALAGLLWLRRRKKRRRASKSDKEGK
jgi:hypothetical protein